MLEAEPLTFAYSTSEANETNWIGIWHRSGGGPVDEEQDEPSLTWDYAPEEDGTLQLPVDDLEPGEYTAFFLAQDGYEWLAEPVDLIFEGLPANLSFPTNNATLHNARQLEEYSARIDGLLLGQGRSTVTFAKSGGDAWVEVSSNGVISGTPDESSSETAQIEILATADNDSNATIHISIPVRSTDEKLVDTLAVMSYNMWSGGANVNKYHEKQLRFILESNVDVIGLQEAASGNHTRRLGEALGWDYWQSNWSVGVVSRYPIVQEYGSVNVSGGVRISLNGNGPLSEVNLWNSHLGSDPYGPYDFCFFNMTDDEVLENEASAGRVPQMTELLDAIQAQLANSANIPVILTGDMNAPSHLDWIDALKEQHCGIGDFPWPTSVLPTEAGFLDSYGLHTLTRPRSLVIPGRPSSSVKRDIPT